MVTLLMQDYNASDRRIDILESTRPPDLNKNRWKDEAELKEYIKSTERSPGWYKQTDKKLQPIVVEFSKFAHHSHPGVRLELANMAALLIDNCVHTMPTSVGHLVDIVISLSEDADVSVSDKNKQILEDLSSKLTRNEFKSLLDNLEESFYGVVTSMPRKFNGIGKKSQIEVLSAKLNVFR
jgi:hypothetical protein